MRPKRELRVAIAGWGRAGSHLHAGSLRALPGARLVAVCDPDADARARAAGEIGAERVYADARRLLDDPAIDVLALCQPVPGRAGLACAALAAGKPVLLEKPLAIDAGESDRLVAAEAAATAAGVKAMLGMNMRWHPHALQARRRILAGEIGAPELLASTITTRHDDVPPWRRTRATGGGVLNDMAIHHVDLWRWLTGSDVVEVSACARSREWEDDSAAISARLSDGALATAVVGERTVNDNALAVFGRDGAIALSFYRFDGFTLRRGGVPGDRTDRMSTALHRLAQIVGLPATRRHRGLWLSSYRAQWRHFIDCIGADRAPGSSFADGARAGAVIRAAIESARRGAGVAVGA